MFKHSALSTPPDVVLCADLIHEYASHYTSSLFFFPGFLASTLNVSAKKYSPIHKPGALVQFMRNHIFYEAVILKTTNVNIYGLNSVAALVIFYSKWY